MTQLPAASLPGLGRPGILAMRSKPIILVALLLAAFLVNLDVTLVNVALPALVRQLHATTTQLQWVVDAYNLVFAALLLTFGSLSDRFGRKGMLLAGLTVVGTASLAGGFTTSPAQLIAARAVMGLGAAMTFPATLSLISNVFTERRERARAIGLWGAIAGVAIALGPIVGGWLLEHFSWTSIFIAMAPVAAAAVILVALVVPTSKNQDAAAPDIPGLVLSSAFMALLVFTIIEAPTYGWTAARTVAGFAVSAALLAGFIAAERLAAHPMLDVRLFRNLRFSAASGAVTVSFFTLFGFIFLITQYFQFVRGYGPLSTGVRLLPVAMSVGAGSVVGTQLAVRLGTKLVVTTGLVAMAGFYAWVAATNSATLSYGVIAAQMVVYGLGLGLTSAPATESIMGAISRRQAGVGSAVNDSTRLVGGTLGVAIIGSVYASVYGSRLTAHLPAGVPGRVAAIAHESIGAAYTAAGKIAAHGQPALGLALHHASTNAFLRGLTIGALVAGGVAAVGAVLAVLFLPAQPAAQAAEPLQLVSPAGDAGEPARDGHDARTVGAAPHRSGDPAPHRSGDSAPVAGHTPGRGADEP
jgi:EmrB/QacA subfamily drug resistance transporter